MFHCCAVSLKCIMAIDPNIGDVLVPFLLSSLDVAAVNQSHQGIHIHIHIHIHMLMLSVVAREGMLSYSCAA